LYTHYAWVKGVVRLRRISEERTRKEMIDPQLEKAGRYLRDHANVKIEIPACPDALFGVDGYEAEPWNGVSDYRLCRVLCGVQADGGGGESPRQALPGQVGRRCFRHFWLNLLKLHKELSICRCT
jgi:hypothetical protein